MLTEGQAVLPLEMIVFDHCSVLYGLDSRNLTSGGYGMGERTETCTHEQNI